MLSSNSNARRNEKMTTMMDDGKKVSEQKQVSHHAWGIKGTEREITNREKGTMRCVGCVKKNVAKEG